MQAGSYTYKEDGTKNDVMDVYTSDYSYMLKFDKFCKDFPEHWKLKSVSKVGDDIVGKKYSCSWDCVLFRGKPKQGRPLTDEEKQERRERMERMRKEGRI